MTAKYLSHFQVAIAHCLAKLYYQKITVVGQVDLSVPTLYLCSHRNGASDGLVMATALGRTPSLVSVQLLRNPILRLLFDGVPVVRQKDVERYGLAKNSVQSPIDACVNQLIAGGSVCLYPEGTSEWSYQPQRYQQGMAKIIKALQQQGVLVRVQAVGVFYTKPDGFRSRVSLQFAEPFYPKAGSVETLFDELGEQLTATSVNCQNIEHFNQVQDLAWQACQAGDEFGRAFLSFQHYHTKSAPTKQTRNSLYFTQKAFCQMLLSFGFLPIMALARLAQTKADGRNNITFFRLLGAMVGAVLQFGLYLILWLILPMLALCWTVLMVLGMVGWYLYPEPMPVALKDNDNDRT